MGIGMKRLIPITLFLVLSLFIGTSSAVEIILLGRSQYWRTEGKPNLYDDTFLGTTAQGKLILKNRAAEVKKKSGSVTVAASRIIGLKIPPDTIHVRTPIVTIEVSPPSKTLFVGGTVHLTATAKKDSGSSGFGCGLSTTFRWLSSKGNVATVDGSGNVRGVSKGEAKISALCGNKLGYSQITVFDMAGTWHSREYRESSTCPIITYDVETCTIKQTGNLLRRFCGGPSYTGFFTGPTFNWTLDAPYWLNEYIMVLSSSMTGTVSNDGLQYTTSDSWAVSYLDENGLWQTCNGWSRAVGNRLTKP
jgi:hypothetical protein